MTIKYMLSMLAFGFSQRALGWWILGCDKPVSVDRIDPIASPGKLSAHLHTVMGGNAFDWTMDFNKTQTAKCTTCVLSKDLSNYWVPTVYFHDKNGSFVSVKQTGGVNVYYQQRIDHTELEAGKSIRPFPEGFRMVAGDANARTWTDTREHKAIQFACLAPGESLPTFHGFPNRTCDSGLRLQVLFPSCWDGVNIDSDNHRSHVAYPSSIDNGFCPDTHPVRLMFLMYEVTWAVDEFNHLRAEGDQPFVLSNGDATGYSYHGDFLNGWDTDILTNAISNASCGDSTRGDIHLCDVFKPYLLTDDQQNQCKTVPRKTREPVNGTIAKLPGCNPVTAEGDVVRSC